MENWGENEVEGDRKGGVECFKVLLAFVVDNVRERLGGGRAGQQSILLMRVCVCVCVCVCV